MALAVGVPPPTCRWMPWLAANLRKKVSGGGTGKEEREQTGVERLGALVVGPTSCLIPLLSFACHTFETRIQSYAHSHAHSHRHTPRHTTRNNATPPATQHTRSHHVLCAGFEGTKGASHRARRWRLGDTNRRDRLQSAPLLPHTHVLPRRLLFHRGRQGHWWGHRTRRPGHPCCPARANTFRGVLLRSRCRR